jgi:hypothetical protein
MTRRRWVAAAVGALLIAVAVATTVWVVPAASVMFGRAVIPPLAWDSVPVTVEAANHGGGIEGDMHFVEARSADGQLVWYQPLVWQPDTPPAAIGAAWLPPGSYVFTLYLRNCGGNCGSLGAPSNVCTFPYSTEGRAGYEVVIEWDWNREPCASERPATH